MIETEEKESESGLADHARRLMRDAIDYAASVFALAQARATELALSGVVFLAIIVGAAFLALGAVVLLFVSFGVWLAHATGSAALALLILGGVALVAAAILGWWALRWLSQLRS